jgi:NADH dehydrogenase
VILIAGGTGRLGTLVVHRLVDQGLDVRILTRDPQRAAHLPIRQVDVVTGDVRDAEGLARALVDVDVVVSAVQGLTSPGSVDRDGNANLADAAKRVGADLVLMSTVGAAAHSPTELFRMKYAAEQHAAASGVPTTVVRATAFLELWVELLERTATHSGRPLIFGRGDNPINFVSVADVAAVVERVTTDPTTRGQIVEVGGTDNLTLTELASAVQTAAARCGAPRHVSPTALRLMANTIGRIKPEIGRQARMALFMDHADLTFDAAPLHRSLPELPTTTLADALSHAKV